MAATIAMIVGQIISTGIKLYGASQTPDYPSAPKLLKLNVQKAKEQMQQYESRRMQASIDAWKARFPLLYEGGKAEIENIARNQQGMLSPQVSGALKSLNLGTPKEGDQYKLAVDLGLSPITLAQRTSQAVTRQIALNPEWTNKISGGTLASMMANNYQNANAFSQFLGAQNTAMSVANAQRNIYNTQALTTGLLGGAQMGMRAYINAQQDPSTRLSPWAASSDVTTPGYYVGSTSTGYAAQPPPYSQPYPAPGQAGYYPAGAGGYGSSYGTGTPLLNPEVTNPYGTYGLGLLAPTDPFSSTPMYVGT